MNLIKAFRTAFTEEPWLVGLTVVAGVSFVAFLAFAYSVVL